MELSGQHRDDTSGLAHAKAGRRCGNNVLECLAIVDLGRMNERVGADESGADESGADESGALRRFSIVLAGSGAEESAQSEQERERKEGMDEFHDLAGWSRMDVCSS